MHTEHKHTYFHYSHTDLLRRKHPNAFSCARVVAYIVFYTRPGGTDKEPRTVFAKIQTSENERETWNESEQIGFH